MFGVSAWMPVALFAGVSFLMPALLKKSWGWAFPYSALFLYAIYLPSVGAFIDVSLYQEFKRHPSPVHHLSLSPASPEYASVVSGIQDAELRAFRAMAWDNFLVLSLPFLAAGGVCGAVLRRKKNRAFGSP